MTDIASHGECLLKGLTCQTSPAGSGRSPTCTRRSGRNSASTAASRTSPLSCSRPSPVRRSTMTTMSRGIPASRSSTHRHTCPVRNGHPVRSKRGRFLARAMRGRWHAFSNSWPLSSQQMEHTRRHESEPPSAVAVSRRIFHGGSSGPAQRSRQFPVIARQSSRALGIRLGTTHDSERGANRGCTNASDPERRRTDRQNTRRTRSG